MAAIKACVERRQKECIGPLVGLIEEHDKKKDRTWLEVRSALRKLTAQDFESPIDWRKYWDGAKASFDPKNIGAAPDGRTVVGTGDVDFFGRAIYSRNVIFLIDVSFSMIMYDESEAYRGLNPERDLQRLYRAQKQLVHAIRRLPSDARFNVIAFSDGATPWRRGLQKAASSTVKSAARFVGGFRAKNATHTDDALKKAFEDPNVDTVILLTDGAPFQQGDTSSLVRIEKTLQWVKNHNRARKIRIDTFGFTKPGKWPPGAKGRNGVPLRPPPSAGEVATFVDFLTRLAEENGGFFQPIQ